MHVPRRGCRAVRLLNHRRLTDHSRLPLCFLLALLVRHTLARGDVVEGAPLCLHPHVGVAGKHGTRDVAESYSAVNDAASAMRFSRLA